MGTRHSAEVNTLLTLVLELSFFSHMFLWACSVFMFLFMFHQWAADYIYILSASLTTSVLIRAGY